MNTFRIKAGNGLQLDDPDGLTTKFVKDPNVSKNDDGLYIDEIGVAQNIRGKIDAHTVVLTGLDKNRNGMLGINHSVVVCNYSMCQHVVTDRSSVKEFKVDTNQIKTIHQIRGEMNAVYDCYTGYGKSIPMGIAITQYFVQPGDLLTLRKSFCAEQMTSGSEIWPVAAEDMNRYETDEITVLFYIEDAVWSGSGKLESLVLQCLWSSLDNFVAGERYGSPNLPVAQSPPPKDDPADASFPSYTQTLKEGTIVYSISETNEVTESGKIDITGIYTIVNEKTISGVRYGKLKSGIGYVKLS